MESRAAHSIPYHTVNTWKEVLNPSVYNCVPGGVLALMRHYKPVYNIVFQVEFSRSCGITDFNLIDCERSTGALEKLLVENAQPVNLSRIREVSQSTLAASER